MTISDYILLATAIVGVYYAYETHKMRKAVTSQLDTARKTALLSAYSALFQINMRIVEKDSGDAVARSMIHYHMAIEQVSENAEKLKKLVNELEQT